MASTMQLEFAQAMSDFKTMFPDMDKEVIEAVLRANQGAVDATIDQLLAMSTDNQNEKLRNELDHPIAGGVGGFINKPEPAIGNLIDDIDDGQSDSFVQSAHIGPPLLSISPATTALNTGASPKIKKPLLNGGGGGGGNNIGCGSTDGSSNTSHSSSSCSPLRLANSPGKSIIGFNGAGNGAGGGGISGVGHDGRLIPLRVQHKWDPPMLGPLPPGFLRLSDRSDGEMPDEQVALMLQNEEFMNELRWNQEFMLSLEKEQQQDQKRGEDDAVFRERLKHMGKRSRKKFLQLARVFTWQGSKKPGAVRHPDSLLLQEEHSDDDDTPKNRGGVSGGGGGGGTGDNGSNTGGKNTTKK